MELIIAIAALCQVHVGWSGTKAAEGVDSYQLKCQRYYLECYEHMNGAPVRALVKCVRERVVK